MPIDPTPDILPDPHEELNHPSALYDPSVHDDQLVAIFDTTADAQAALDALSQHGLANDASIVAGNTSPEPASTGLFAGLLALFAPDDEMTHYNEGLRRGHALLVAHPTPANRLQIVQVLEAHHPIDFDAKLEEWRAAGWANLQRQEDATMGAAADAPAGQQAPSASLGAAAADTQVRNELEAHLRVNGQRDPARDAGPIRSYRPNQV